MKKIFTLMLAFACALFVGVSCTNDGTSDPTPNPGEGGGSSEPTYAVTIGLAEVTENFPAAGGSVELAYTLSTPYAGEVLTASTTTSWLEVAVSDEQPVVKVTALVNNTAGMTRTGSFTLSYKDAKDLTVSVTQDAAESAFTVEWSDQTQLGATATVTANDPDMVFGAFTFGQSVLVQNGGVMPLSTEEVSLMDPAEYAAEQLALMADPMGYGGLGIYFYQMADPYMGGGSAMLYPNYSNTLNCSLLGRWGATEKKMYLVVVGLNWGLNMETGEDTTTQKGALHICEVETLPQPVVKVAQEVVSASHVEGCVLVDCEVENPTWDGVLSADFDCDWLDAAASSAGKLHLYCKENPYAKARSAEVQVTYTYNCMVTQYGETMEMPVTATATVKVEQAANPNVKPVTFKITVKETHFDRIVVDVKPSDSEAYYVLGCVSKETVNNYAQWGDAWSSVCEYALGEEAHQGTLTNYELKINTTYAEEPDQWTHFVYAFQTNAESSAVAGAPTYVETPVTNDTPKVELSHSELVYDGSGYTLTVVGKGGDYAIDIEFVNAVADGMLAFNTYPSVTEKTFTTNGVLGNGGLATIDNEAKKLYFTVNDYPADWSKSYDPYVSLSFTYKQYVDGAFTNTSYGKSFNLKIILKPAPAEETPAE